MRRSTGPTWRRTIPIFRNKRETLARGLGLFGALGLLERLARRPCLVALCYHRIGSAADDPYFAPVISATPEGFASQVKRLQSRFRLLDREGLSDLIDGGFRPSEPTALITFDDLYRDQIEIALPILRDLGAPAAFFVPTGFLDRPRLTWWDHVALAIGTTPKDRITLDQPERVEIDLRTMTRPEAIAAAIGPLLRADPERETEWLAHLDDRAEVAIDSEARGRALFATWDDVRTLDASGMIVGSHTRDHLNLAHQSEARQADALRSSRERLHEVLGHPIDTIAYPYGQPGDFTPATQRLAGEIGYRAAFSAIATANRPGETDPMDVHRISIGSTDSPPLFRARMALASSFGRPML